MTQPPPECLKEMKVQAVQDLKESSVLLVKNTPEVGIAHVMNCEDFSDFSKLCRVTAYVIRFVNNIKARSSRPVSPLSSGSLTSEEVLFCESMWIKESQKSLPLNRNFKQQCAQLGVITEVGMFCRYWLILPISSNSSRIFSENILLTHSRIFSIYLH